MRETEFAVVGGGPAGLCAAVEAARAGVRVTLIDENARPGGQLFKQIHKFFGSKEHFAGVRGFEIGAELFREVEQSGVDVMLGAVVWGIFSDHVLGIVRANKSLRLKPTKILLATGAMENALAFPGWTLPGVMGAGALQTLVNLHRVLPGKRVLMVGSGNVGLIVSYQLLQAGAQVVAVLEAMPQIGGYAVHAEKLRRNGVPILTSTTIKAATGEGRVESAVSVALGKGGKEIPGTEKALDVDLICLAVGLSPMDELAWMGGCQFGYVPALGGHILVRDSDLQTSVPGIYAAGDVAGIAEASTAMEEGRLAGVAVAEALGYLDAADAAARKEIIRNRLAGIRSEPAAGTTRHPTPRSRGDRERAAPFHLPSAQRLARGPIAVVECSQQIPCNPCETVCPHSAIKVGECITDPPRLDEDRCTGCGLCVPACPGQAIFIVDASYSDREATVQLPFEFIPLPSKGDVVVVDGLDRDGRRVCSARVLRSANPERYDHTPVITVAVPREQAMTVRNIAVRRGEPSNG